MKLIYAIQHDVTKRIYVGCTGNTGRIEKHFGALKSKRHKVELMNEDCEKYGFCFTAYMLEIVSKHIASDREMYWMEYFDTQDPNKGYNYKDFKAKKRPVDAFPVYNVDVWRNIMNLQGYGGTPWKD